MKQTIAWSILLVLGQFSSTVCAQSQTEIAKQFAGMWPLVSNPQRLADGTTREGANSVAYAMFDAGATRMCFISMNPNRPRWKSETAPTPEEGFSAIKGFGAYCDGQRFLVNAHVETLNHFAVRDPFRSRSAPILRTLGNALPRSIAFRSEFICTRPCEKDTD